MKTRTPPRMAAALCGVILLLSAGGAHCATYLADVAIGRRSDSREASRPVNEIVRAPGGGLARASAGDRSLTTLARTGTRRQTAVAEAAFEETYRIVGPTLDLVPVFLTARISLAGEDLFLSSAFLEIQQDGADGLDLSYRLSQFPGSPAVRDQFNVLQIVDLRPNEDFVFSLRTFARARRGEARATISRPTLTIDPDFAAAYQLVRSADLPPPAAVPEPGAWALMVLGFGGLGAVLRRRRADLVAISPAAIGRRA